MSARGRTAALYTDGACATSDGTGGWAWMLVDADGRLLGEASGSEAATTSNRMELRAAIEALRPRTLVPARAFDAIVVRSDSRYLVDGFTKWLPEWKKRGWKTGDGQPVKNHDLWELLDAAVAALSVETRWSWIRGHNNETWNVRCDATARRCAGTTGANAPRSRRMNQREVDGSVDGGLSARAAGLPNERRSVLQDWVTQLPLREQGTLLTAVRGCDDEPKTWTARGVAYSPGRRLTAFIRSCFMVPADAREVDAAEGAFFQSRPPEPFKPSEFGHLPQHWYAHAMHALEVIGYRHPDQAPGGVGTTAFLLYSMMVHNLHLNIETPQEFACRLSEDRVATGTIVS